MTRNKNSLANLKPAKKGEVRNPDGAPRRPHFMTRFREALLNDLPWQKESIATFKKRMRGGDAQFWKMFFDQIGPEAAQAAAQALGVTVNVSQSQTVALVAPDISSTDRLMELARLFAKIPALPEVQPVQPLPDPVQN